MLILYFILSIFVILILFKLYVKIKFGFWAYQPVFHRYNLLYWIYPCGIINKELPETNKFCNFYNITTSLAYKLHNAQIERFSVEMSVTTAEALVESLLAMLSGNIAALLSHTPAGCITKPKFGGLLLETLVNKTQIAANCSLFRIRVS